MSDAAVTVGSSDPGRAPPLLSAPAKRIVAAIVVVSVALQMILTTMPDVSWLFVVAEKWLSGARPYIDIIETNPPMSVFLYLPAVVLEKWTGLSAEAWQKTVTFVTIGFGLGCSAAIMARSGRAAAVERYVIAGALALALLPMVIFSEREHLATALMLPILALFVAREEAECEGGTPAGGRHIGRSLPIIAGAAAGLAASIKPHFVLVVLLPAIYLAIRRRSLRPLFAIETLVAAAIVIAYAAIVAGFFPVYLRELLPELTETYRMERYSLPAILCDRAFLLTIVCTAATLVLAGRAAARPAVVIPALAALGFAIAFVEQAKGWRYHLYPSIALVFMIFYCEALPRFTAMVGFRPSSRQSATGPKLAAWVALAAFSMLVPNYTWSNRSGLPLLAAIERVAPHPRVLAVSFSLAIGHPLTRMAGGTWVGSYGHQWLSSSALYRREQPGVDPATVDRMNGFIARDRATIANDIRTGRPDVILADTQAYDWDDMVARTPGVSDLLENYVRTAEADGVILLVRRDRLPPAGLNMAGVR